MAKKRTRKPPAAGRKAKRTVKKARPKRPTRRAAPRVMDQEAMMAAWQRARTPGAGHQALEPLVGTWRAQSTFCMSPDAPPEISEATSENRWALGGRFLEQRYQGTIMGAPFEGLGYTGYDNSRKKYVGTWMDSFGTGIMHSIGVGKPTDTEIDQDAESFDPMGKPMRCQCKLRIQGHDHHVFEMWMKAPNGRRFRSLLIEYTRL